MGRDGDGRMMGGDATTLSIRAPDGDHDLVIGAGLLRRAGALLGKRGLEPGRVAVVADATVHEIHGAALMDALAADGFDPRAIQVPAGEAAKTTAAVAALWDAFAAVDIGRDGLVLTLGGGAVCDAAGFAAATWLRGVPRVALPTTLLAMVDAALGGKTGIDLPAGKNLAGTFTSPRLVLADTATLLTLPAEEWRAGLAEVAKHGIIEGGELLARLEADPPADPPRDDDALDRVAALVAMAARVKIGVIERDFAEAGPREALNLGHTFAHGFEQASGWLVRHGDAVAVGLRAAARLAAATGVCEPALPHRVDALLDALRLPATLAGLDPDAVIAAMGRDKKRRGGRLRLVLPAAPGSIVTTESPGDDALRDVLAGVLQP